MPAFSTFIVVVGDITSIIIITMELKITKYIYKPAELKWQTAVGSSLFLSIIGSFGSVDTNVLEITPGNTRIWTAKSKKKKRDFLPLFAHCPPQVTISF